MTIINYIVHPLCLLQDDRISTETLISKLETYVQSNPGRYILEFQDNQTVLDMDIDYVATFEVLPRSRAPYKKQLREMLANCDTFEGVPDNYTVTGPVHIIGHGALESACVKNCVEELVHRLCSQGINATYEINSETCIDVDLYTQ